MTDAQCVAIIAERIRSATGVRYPPNLLVLHYELDLPTATKRAIEYLDEAKRQMQKEVSA